MRLALALALTLAAAPALAQDLSGQFAGAVRAFTLPGTQGLEDEALAEDDPILALLPGLAGDWVPLRVLFPDPGAYDPALLAGACDRLPTTLTPLAQRSFELRRTTGPTDAPFTLAVRYDWVTGNSFDRGVSEEELVAFNGWDKMATFPAFAMAVPEMRGPAQLFVPGPDLLVIVAPNLPPEFWGRCPA
jgi:hypothetical protein